MSCPEPSTSGITPTLELARNRCEGCSAGVDAGRTSPRCVAHTTARGIELDPVATETGLTTRGLR